MKNEIQKILLKYKNEYENIYIGKTSTNDQDKELELREKVASANNFDLSLIAKHHSVEVMDCEVKKFILKIKKNAIILDVGCGWCWHWRDVFDLRKDIKIFALDFALNNFKIAKKVFNKDNIKNIYFINENILETQLPKNYFDAIWSCQTYQHIPDLAKAIKISHELLKPGGEFLNYNLNYSVFSWIKNFFNNSKKIQMKNYFLNKDVEQNVDILESIFKNKVRKNIVKYYFIQNFFLVLEKKFNYRKNR